MIVQIYLLVKIMQDGGVFEKPVINKKIFIFSKSVGAVLPQKLHTSLNEWVTAKQVSLEIPVHTPPRMGTQR